MNSVHTITKSLSANDTGETGGHQAGILVPKAKEILSYFPGLNREEKNPRVHLHFTDDNGAKWEFAFIYYNNRFFGGTRNEYRLTRMTPFFRAHNLCQGDELILKKTTEGVRSVTYRRSNETGLSESGILKLGSGWKVINF